MQVNVNILEAQKLAGVNINPAVFIRVGAQKRHTATQKSTNCPFYNEVEPSPVRPAGQTLLSRFLNKSFLLQNFQFEFQEAPQIFFDEVIEIKVCVYFVVTFPADENLSVIERSPVMFPLLRCSTDGLWPS